MRRSIKKALIVMGLIGGILLVVGGFVGIGMLISGIGFGDCSSQITDQIPSPDHKNVAYVIERDCGATGGSLDLAIDTPGKSPTEGNVFSCEYGDFHVHWKNSHELQISYTKDAEVYTQETNVNGIKIDYVVTKPELS